jgi:CubicO group peptidase (beta-lactamase class C family)
MSDSRSVNGVEVSPPHSRPIAAAAALLALCFVTQAQAQAPAPPRFPDAAASDPVALGWMVGSPPPPARRIAFADGSFYRFPQLRWSFSHWRELFPTAHIARGPGPVSVLPRAERNDLDAVTFTPLGGTAPLTWAQSLEANYTDGIVVLHRGRIVYERYSGALTADGQHIAHSVTKSFFGTIAAALVEEGKLDPAARVTRYVPELQDSAFGDATVRQVMDMTTALAYSETYADPKAEVWDFARAGGILPKPADYSGPRSLYDFLVTVKKGGEHDQGFAYRSPNAEVLVWILRRVTGQSAAQLLHERLWRRLGAEQDAYIGVDEQGNAVGSGGLNLQLRDLARFGELMRLGGRWQGQQVIPANAIADIRRGADRAQFVSGGYSTLPGWSYRSQWWIAHDDHGAYAARGVHGQALYIDPKAEMVIARFGSHPLAGNVSLDPTTLPAFRALAEHLLRNP